MRSSPDLWRTWNPATRSWAVFWSGAALVLTALALFTSPHRPAFYGFLIIAWAGTLALVIAPAIIGRHQRHAASGEAHRRLPGRPSAHPRSWADRSHNVGVDEAEVARSLRLVQPGDLERVAGQLGEMVGGEPAVRGHRGEVFVHVRLEVG